ncbi:MAG: hypothetical protein Q8J64_07205 [Thermodesulfovibrionales bacterium]|nr:hypothetical protein [Thermodesulfovibrionales bacterium]
MRILTDQEIAAYISEPKVVPNNWYSGLGLKDKSQYQHREKELEIEGREKNLFRVIIRQNKLNILDFSIILTLREKDSNVEYNLLRVNGKHPSRHTNKWEKENKLPGHTFWPHFHIHKATQRYQESGYNIDGYAEVTPHYSDFHSALNQFLLECNFKREDEGQFSLFKGGETL